ncbi:MAG: hypothetical protein EBQ48_00345, partial [Betaproteobacteria bacterium]|nr:hypothetical protein [Betaproteobacteria bacterium]
FNSSSAVNGVTVKLAGWVGNSGSLPSGYTGSALDNWGNIDVFRNIFGVEGSRYDDLIVGDSSNNVLDGQGGSDTLDGGSGVDTAEYNQALAGINLDLTLGKAIDDGQGRGSAAAGEAVEVDQLIGIENVVGGSGNDMIRGDAFNNRLEGQGGNDRISGEAGDDTLLGGEGNDTLEGGDGSDHLYADFGDDTIDGGSERFGGLYLGGTVSSWDRLRATADISGGSDLIIYSSAPVAHTFDLGVDGVGSARPIGVSSDGNNDTLRSIEVVVATPFNDVLRGSNRDIAEYFRGGLGDDTIYGGAVTGTDAGSDRIDYRFATGAIQLNLQIGTVQGADGNDQVFDIEGAFGSNYNDVLIGNDRNNILEGNAGDDTIDGAAGNDQVSYQRATAAVFVDLSRGASSGPDGVDTLRNIEAVRGSAFDDTLVGSAGNDGFQGREGNDSIDAGSGNDLLIGGVGNDTLKGGVGSDIFYYTAANQGVDLIVDFSLEDRIEIAAQLQGSPAAGTGNTVSGRNIQVSADGSFTRLWIDTDGALGHEIQLRVAGNYPSSSWLIEQAPANTALPGTVSSFIRLKDGPPASAQPSGAFLSEGNHIALGSALVNVFGAAGV